jgi:uncharacterized protein YycO
MSELKMYMTVRHVMKTGDCILWQSNSVVGWLIRRFSRANVNHASLVISLSEYGNLVDRRFLLEALDAGIVLHLLSRRLMKFSGKVWWYSLQDKYDSHRDKIGEWALLQVGVKYDYKSLFRQMVGRVSACAKEFFCSEYCFIGWKESGIPLEGKAPRPGDIVKLGIFKKPIRIL